jgi:hypothetical protein
VADRELLVFAQDMSISRDAFLRNLPAAVDHAEYVVDGPEIRAIDAGRAWRIVLEPLSDLALGMIVLPRQRVRIFLTEFTADEAARFLSRFELYFRRAGG